MYKERLKKLQNLLKEESCDALIVEDPINLYYLTGLHLSAGTLLATTQGSHLIVDSRYIEKCKKSSPFPVLLAENNATLTNLLSSSELNFVKELAFDSGNTTYADFLKLQKETQKLNLRPLDNPVAKLRCIKDTSEIDLLRDAAKLGSEGFDFICTLLKEGITEEEVAIELEIFWRRRGGKKLGFDPIIAFGANSSMPHYSAGKELLKKGDPVLIDIGVNYEDYHSDMTRVVFFGEPNSKILEIYDIVRKAQQAALALCRPNTRIGDLDDAARKSIIQQGYGDQFGHNLGHGVGLEIHESPTLRNKPPHNEIPLQEGMVITIEPGIYLPNIGGVRLEDTVVIQKDGHENLTNRSVEPMIIGS
ncbi:MAG: Aminopeptidase YpdF [Chlamydiae bacterium]|nr:Aminopeptidase YpdF [Chlamydiota bacterium]